MTLNPLVLTDCRLYLDGADLTGYSNKAELGAKAAGLDRTTFGSGGWKERKGGVFDGSAMLEGFWQAGDPGQPDDVWWTNLGVATVPLTGVPTSGAVGSLAYLTRGLDSEYKPGAKHGELLGWSAQLDVNWPIVRGQIFHPQGTARTATGSGTAIQLGAVSSTQALYICLHALSVTDGSLTVKFQSDNGSGFPSATDVATFNAVTTTVGGQAIRVPGPITDDWFRAQWTISGGSTHSFLFAVSAGIGPK